MSLDQDLGEVPLLYAIATSGAKKASSLLGHSPIVKMRTRDQALLLPAATECLVELNQHQEFVASGLG